MGDHTKAFLHDLMV